LKFVFQEAIEFLEEFRSLKKISKKVLAISTEAIEY